MKSLLEIPFSILRTTSKWEILFNDNNNGAGKIDAKHKHYSLPYRLKTRTVQLFNVSLSETAREPVYHAAGGVNSYRPRLNNGENISFIDKGKGELILTSNINQGAGGLYFEGNFTVSPKTTKRGKARAFISVMAVPLLGK